MEDINNWQGKLEICIYAQKLLDKITDLNNSARNLQAAVDITEVKKYHGSQMRQSGEPFYSHPIEVAYMVADYLPRLDVIVTAILHDTIEDTELTKQQIAQAFGENVANSVIDLTRIKEDSTKISAAEMVEILFTEEKYDLLLIKLLDRLHNMKSIGVKSLDKIKKTQLETLSTFILLSTYLGSIKIEQELLMLCITVGQEQNNIKKFFQFLCNELLPNNNLSP